MSTEHDKPTHSSPTKVCDSCGYSLQGLPDGTKCPECGHQSVTRTSNIRESTMSFQASPRYIAWIRYGFLICLLAILSSLAAPMVIAIGSGSRSMLFPVALFITLACSACWPIGVFMITRSRTGMGEITHDNVLDNQTFVKVIRALSLAWPAWMMLYIGDTLSTGGTGVLMMIAIGSIALISWIGLIPVSVYFAELAYWAADDKLAVRLRGVAWVMTVFGILTIATRLVSLTPLAIAAPAKVVNIWTTGFSFIATIVLFVSMFRMSVILNWAMSHQRISAQKHARLAARIEKEMLHGGVSTQTPCDECGYDLQGLPRAGNCPECGSTYGTALQFPVRDPALDKPTQSQAPIHVEESSGGSFTHPRPLGLPLEDASNRAIEDGDSIPLAGEA